MREAHVRARAAEKRARMAESLLADAQARVRAVMNARLNEPRRVEGCAKVRFHRLGEAEEWGVGIAARTGEPVEVYHAYQCRVCPRSPVTMGAVLACRASVHQ